MEITWLGHASFKLEGSKRVYIDPWKLKKGEPADLVLVSHDHYDHFSREDIDKVRGPDTVVVTVAGVASQLSGEVRTIKPGESLEVNGVVVKAVPAYNREKQFHPKERGWVGYLVTLDGETVYYAGDTDRIPEMAGLEADTALLPVSGTYVMDPEEAAGAAGDVRASRYVPYHYGEIVGSEAEARRFQELVGDKVRVLEPSR